MAIPGGHGTPAPYFDNVRLQWVRGAAAAVPSPVASIAATAVPNPFNPSVTIRWTADAGSRATVRVHDLSGRLVASLFDGEASGAAHEVVWNGRDEAGQAVAAGVYLCRISTGSDAGSQIVPGPVGRTGADRAGRRRKAPPLLVRPWLSGRY